MATIVAVAAGFVLAAGSYLLYGNKGQNTSSVGSRLSSSSLTTSTEGAGITQLYGRMRLDGQIIWATEFKETVNTKTTKVKTGGKGGGGSSTQTETTYTYSISVAIAFCEGNGKASLSRMWADGKEVDISTLNIRFYPGSQTQNPDPFIESVQGSGNVPGYRGTCYIVIEELQLENYGNRVPQITAEVVVPLETDDPVDIQNAGEAFTLIPAAGETVYSAQQINVITGGTAPNETTKPDNVHNAFRKPDVVQSIDNLLRMQNNLDAVEVAVTWFGNDLRAGVCQIRPRIEDAGRKMTPTDWTVAGYVRGTAQEVSRDANNRPVFGGTPSDASVTSLIQYLHSKGKRVIFYPFIMMDVPTGNTKPNPYSANETGVGQPVFPWRGRITCSPAPGYAGTVDKTAAAGMQINAFFNEYDAMVTHYASLCVAAGGVEGFVIGSELVGLTTSRSALGVYPAVTRLVSLAATVKGVVGSGCKVGYAADWSEWTHSTADGYWFHLDPLWSSANIDFCGVDNYLPLADWRNGTQHLDYDGVNGPVSAYEPAYIASQVEGGEYYDYYYATDADRTNQNRTPITDGLGKVWMNRRKDFRGWWLNTHYNRPGWVESGSPTGWTPGSKPIWFTEFGVPAIDKGTNQPNVFYDPKSSENAFPYFSSGLRDDFIQRVAVETVYEYWRDNAPTSGPLKMIEPHNMFVWTWDARPFPDYPVRSDVWSDGSLWFRGHWWTGRIESVPLPRLVAALCKRGGMTSDQYDVSGLYGPGALVRGFQVDRPQAIRESLETLMSAYLFDAFESEGKVKFVLRSNTRTYSISGDSIVVSGSDPVGVTLKRGQETELPSSVKITYIDEFNDFNSAATDGKTSRGYSQNIEQIELPIILTQDYARSLADGIVQQRWIERQSGTITLPPSLSRLDPGDAVTFPVGTHSLTGRLTVVSLGEAREAEFFAFDPGIFSLPAADDSERLPGVADLYGKAALFFVDIPLFTGAEVLPHSPRVAANASPWPGAVSVYRLLPDATHEFSVTHPYRNAVGRLNVALSAGPVGVWDRGSVINVTFDYGALSSTTEAQALENAYALGVYNAAKNEWEVIQFATATLVGTNTYEVKDLLRGQLGTEHAQGAPNVPIGATVILIEPYALSPLSITAELVDDPNTYSYGPARYPQSDDTYQSKTFTGKKVGLRPYAPSDLGLTVALFGGNLKVSWKRRTRFGGDSWKAEEVPLNEEAEQYRLRIYNGAVIVREVVVTSPNFVYTNAMQVADFGAAQTTLTVDVAQYGAAFGSYGIVRTATLVIEGTTP
jgi:hypothetical protein